MIRQTEKNAAEYQIPARYALGNALEMPFADSGLDGVISHGSLHEWEAPGRVFDEIDRVLRPGGRYCITGLGRDAAWWKKRFVYYSVHPQAMRPGLVTSLQAAYTLPEITAPLASSALKNAQVKKDFFGLCIWGRK